MIAWALVTAIVGGTPSTDDAVVAFVERPACSDEFTVTCSGTLVAPQVVLTAAHCVVGKTGLEVHVGAPVGSGAFIAVTETVVHPMFDDASHAYDIAIVRLAEPAGVTPIALPTATLGASSIGTSARVVGFGVVGAGEVADGERRTGTMQISAVDPLTFTATPSPSNTCGGDSGGPVFVGDQLLGITIAGDPTCKVRATNARVDISIDDFVRPQIQAPLPTTPPPSGGPPCMKPGDGDDGCNASGATSGWLALALALRGCTRRRRATA